MKSDVNIVFETVNFRYFNNFFMIVSCEKGLRELLDIDDAIGSRLIEMKRRKLNFRVYDNTN